MFDHLPNSWRRGFETAAAAAEHSNGKQPCYKLGSALYKGKNLVSIGFNIYDKTHPESVHFKRGAYHHGNIHAEMTALIKRRHYGDKNQTIYVYRGTIVDGRVVPSLSKPCNNCQALLKLAGVKVARYINESGEAEEMRF
jgi:deoxycytidylate deaminase